MLILSRKIGESLIIDGKIEVKIVDISGDKIKIGVEAPKEVSVFRNELCKTVEENKQAVQAVKPSALKSFLKTQKTE
ncbi:MAG: carbon storage regulator CsrA [Ruminococcus sp.]|nr:carbon storage regulator CsrA [Ruminococcus sp.]